MNPNTEYERFTQEIYRQLGQATRVNAADVQHNVKLEGRSGQKHQIDVYWEYEKDGKTHRVAIECKNYSRRISLEKVCAFKGVLDDLDGVSGIMVSKVGFQKGAKKYAAEYGISLKELRRPGWNEIIGSITTVVHADIRHILFLFDDEWVKEHNFDLNKIRRFYASFQFEKVDYWKAATHLPIETKNHFIRSAKGKKISSLEELEKQLPENPEPGTEIIFPFEDGWVESRYWGPVKIREVKFEYESKVQETTLNLAADDFVEAILEDALGGEANYVPKY